MKTSQRVKVNNAALAGVLGVAHKAVVNVPCKNGIPTSREWRNRLRDAKIDHCVTVIDDSLDLKPKRGGR